MKNPSGLTVLLEGVVEVDSDNTRIIENFFFSASGVRKSFLVSRWTIVQRLLYSGGFSAGHCFGNKSR